MTTFAYQEEERPVQMGLVALQADETIERDFRRLFPEDVEIMVSRVPSATEVTRDSLQAMAGHLTYAASLFPDGAELKVVAYGCTSGTAQIGAEEIANRVKDGAETKRVTEPLSALIAACEALGVKHIAVLSPYIESVSARLMEVLNDNAIETTRFGSFAESEEAKVVRISEASLMDAAKQLMAEGKADALFISCTNIRALDVLTPLEEALGIPVLSSNQVLAWHMMALAGVHNPKSAKFGRLFSV